VNPSEMLEDTIKNVVAGVTGAQATIDRALESDRPLTTAEMRAARDLLEFLALGAAEDAAGFAVEVIEAAGEGADLAH
jgi:hypothetical protein